ncbi:ATP-binding cassette transporter snq2 [Basidiobolus ranarum]|uniref:ATP-binding cassette transporter snq2 n=1 Tax=Basidiobolus ranarum TaxID=34480 RepID=A0ABR2W792_9FUNG
MTVETHNDVSSSNTESTAYSDALNEVIEISAKVPVKDQENSWGEGDLNIDVLGAAEEYEDLRRELSRVSSTHRVNTRYSSIEEDCDDFDLTDFLQSTAKAIQEAAIKPKRIGITFKNLTVVGDNVSHIYMPDCSTPFKKIGKLLNPLTWVRKSTSKVGPNNDDDGRVILHNINGFCKDGEMVFVLGRPGAGCSTLLRVLANQHKQYKRITGEVSYGGIYPEEFVKRYVGEVAYNPEDDFHFPTLTVQETIDFALKCKTPGNLLPNDTK